jgi:hypothetical protein
MKFIIDTMKKAAGIIILILLAVIAIQEYRIRRYTGSETVTVTVIHDTITITTPAPVLVAETGQIRAKLPVAELPVIELSIIDSLPAVADSAEVIIPVSTKIYEDSLFRAVISGYNVSLDSIQIYRQTVYVDRWHEGVKAKTRRWALGVQVGYGTDFKGMHPYIGVGVSYNLWGF